MQAAESRLFDVIVAEDMDRIFRDQADYHNARKRLDFLGITLHTATGKVGTIDGTLRALMSEHSSKTCECTPGAVLKVFCATVGTLADARMATALLKTSPAS